jgi:type I restriction enzyme S subunit
MELKPGYKQTEVGVIPEDWEVVRLGDMFEFKNGLNKAKGFFGAGTPIVNYMDVYKNRGLTRSDLGGRVTVNKTELRAYEVRKGDVFFTRTSETVDEIGISSVVLEEVCDTVFSGFILRARPKNDALYLNYRKYCFSSESIRTQITTKSSYTTRALTNGKLLSSVYVPIPSLPEQRAIAAALSDVDALIIALDRLIAKKRDIKQAAMQQLLTGKQRLPGFSGAWEVKTFEQCFRFLSTGSNSRSELSESGDTKYIHYGDIHTKWSLVLDCEKDTIPLIQRERVKSLPLLEDGDLVMADASEDYEGIGASIEIKNVGEEKIVAGLHTLLLRSDKTQVADGYKAYITSIKAVKDSLIKMATGISVYGISKASLKSVGIPLPGTIEEQQAIAAVLSDMDAEIAALEQRRDKTRALKQGMMQELLTGKTRLL